jgi:hypoxanthine phosphoribosyltransferase
MPATATPPEHVTCRDERFRLYIDRHTIQERVEELGREIVRDYDGKRPIFVGVLNGAFLFFADLLRCIDVECEVDFLKLSSYGQQKVSSGEVTELKRVDANLAGRHVILVEDIVDTGHSMRFMLDLLEPMEPASLRMVTLLHKPEATTVPDLHIDYVGFEIENLFVLGYGLDYGQLGRNLPDLYILDEVEGDEA